MILVTTGTVTYPFKRLVDSCYKCFENDKKESVVIQTGSYAFDSQVNHIFTFQYLSFPKMTYLYQKANLIISAGGEGSFSLISHYSPYQPIIFPRRKKFYEHVDDQQMMIARALEKEGVAMVADDPVQLMGLVKLYRSGKMSRNFTRRADNTNKKIFTYLDTIVTE